MFDKFSRKVSEAVGSSYTFVGSVVLVCIWFISGTFLSFSNTWQLIINTVTTITTGLIVLVIQHTQNKDTQAIHLKLDELLRAIDKADERLVEIEKE